MERTIVSGDAFVTASLPDRTQIAPSGIPAHCGFDSAPDVATAVAMAEESHGKDCSIVLTEFPPAFNRQ
jgi:hypothetical protein